MVVLLSGSLVAALSSLVCEEKQAVHQNRSGADNLARSNLFNRSPSAVILGTSLL